MIKLATVTVPEEFGHSLQRARIIQSGIKFLRYVKKNKTKTPKPGIQKP